MRRYGTAAQKRRRKIFLDNGVPGLNRACRHTVSPAAATGVVNQNVHARQGGKDLRKHLLHGRFRGDISLNAQGSAPESANLFHNGVGRQWIIDFSGRSQVDVIDDNVGSPSRPTPGICPPQGACRSCNDGHLSLQAWGKVCRRFGHAVPFLLDVVSTMQTRGRKRRGQGGDGEKTWYKHFPGLPLSLSSSLPALCIGITQ